MQFLLLLIVFGLDCWYVTRPNPERILPPVLAFLVIPLLIFMVGAIFLLFGAILTSPIWIWFA